MSIYNLHAHMQMIPNLIRLKLLQKIEHHIMSDELFINTLRYIHDFFKIGLTFLPTDINKGLVKH